MKALTFHGRRDVRVAYEIFQRKQHGAIKILLQP